MSASTTKLITSIDLARWANKWGLTWPFLIDLVRTLRFYEEREGRKWQEIKDQFEQDLKEYELQTD